MRIARTIFMLSLLAGTGLAAASQLSGTWLAKFPAHDVLGNISFMTPFGDQLVLSGSIGAADGDDMPGIIAWNGHDYLSLDPPFDGSIRQQLVWDGNLIVGGRFDDFSTPERDPASYRSVRKWDGHSWSVLGADTEQLIVHDLAVFRGQLLALARYADAPGQSFRPAVLRWETEAWRPLSPELAASVSTDSYLMNLIAAEDELYVFVDPPGNGQGRILHVFRDAVWSVVELPVPIGSVYPIAQPRGGLIGKTYDQPPSLLRIWGGEFRGWVTMREDMEPYVFASASSIFGWRKICPNEFSVDHPYTELLELRGGSWHVLGDCISPTGGPIGVVRWAGQTLLALTARGTKDRHLHGIARLDDERWVPLKPTAGIEVVPSGGANLLPFNGDLVWAGSLLYAGTYRMPGIALFDGHAWKAPAGLPMDYVLTAKRFADRMIVLGFDLLDGGATRPPRFASWDGSSWVVTAEFPMPDVVDFAAHSEGIVAVGQRLDESGDALFAWDGSSWSAIDAGPQLPTKLVSFEDRILTLRPPQEAGDVFELSGLDGSEWLPISEPPPVDLRHLAILETVDAGLPAERLLAVTNRTATDGPHIAIKGRGQSWRDLGSIAWSDRVVPRGATVYRDEVVISCRALGSGPPFLMYGLENGEWKSFATGNPGDRLAVVGDELYVGDSLAGSISCFRFDVTVSAARPSNVAAPLPRLRQLKASAGDDAAVWELQLPRHAQVEAEILDLRGRRVRTLTQQMSPAGLMTLRWSGDDAQQRPVARGVYFLRVRAGGSELKSRVYVSHD